MRHTYLARDRPAAVADAKGRWRPTGTSGAQSPLCTINVRRALVPPRVRGPQVARNPRPRPTAAGLVEVVGGGIFCRQPACFCKREATDRAPAGSTLVG